MSRTLRFFLASEASSADPKTTVVNVKTVECDEMLFRFPPHLQAITLHPKIAETAVYKAARKSMTSRGQFRVFNVTLPAESARLYFDAESNPIFSDELLEEVRDDPVSQSPKSMLIPTVVNSSRSLTTILKDAVVEKFDGKFINATAWLEIFESECVRLEVSEDRYWEAIRLFLEAGAVDWFNSARVEIKSKQWALWKASFLSSFQSKGWSSSRAAYTFRFISGSLVEYANKKRSLLVNMNPAIDEFSKLSLIVHGLPFAVQDKLDRNTIQNCSDLFEKLNSLDRSSRPFPKSADGSKSNFTTFSKSSFQNQNSNVKKGPCTYCEKKGHPGRSHFEADCITKMYDSKKFSKSGQNNVKPAVHNVESNVNTETKTINLAEFDEFLNDLNIKNM